MIEWLELVKNEVIMLINDKIINVRIKCAQVIC